MVGCLSIWRGFLPRFESDASGKLAWVYSDANHIDESGKVIRRGFFRRSDTEHPERTLTGCLRDNMNILPSASLLSPQQRSMPSMGSMSGFVRATRS